MWKLRALHLVLLLLIAAVVGWEFASPWWTLKNMRDAAEKRDSDRLASFIDFPQVRSSLSEQLIKIAESNGPAPAYEAFTRKFGARPVIEPIINVIVSPAALRVALLASPSDAGAIPATQGSASRKRACGIKRQGLQQFRLRCARLPNGEADFVFARRGLGWKLVGIDLPEDYGSTVS